MNLRALAFSLALASAGSASWSTFAHAETCTNDNDCTAHGTACGTDVCNWNLTPHTCVPASASVTGWCGNAADGGSEQLSQDQQDMQCKCKGQGATCVYPYCTIIFVADAGASSQSGSASGSATSGTATSGTASTGSTSPSDAGSTSGSEMAASGTTTDAGVGGGGGGGNSSSGCNIGFSGSSQWGIGLLALGAAAAIRRRRA